MVLMKSGSTATGGYKVILAGQGISNLAAWIATYALRDKGLPVSLLAEIGFFGYLPRASSPFIFNKSNIPTCIISQRLLIRQLLTIVQKQKFL